MKKFIKTIVIIGIYFTSLYAKEVELEHISVQLQWKHQFEFAGFYAAIEKGFYKEVGLDVELIEFQSGTSIVDTVLSGEATYGLGYSSIILDYYHNKPIVMMANFFKQSPLVLLVQKNIKRPSDLKNKTIMGLSDSIDEITLQSMLHKFGIRNNDYKNVSSNFKMDNFINKKVDAMTAFISNETYILDSLGVEYNIFNPTVYGLEYYDNNLFTTKKEVQNNPKRAKDFTKASIRGWKYALANKEEIVEIILEKYNTQNKSKEALVFEARQLEDLILPSVYPVGMIEKTRLEAMIETFKQEGFIDKHSYKNLDQFIFMDNQHILSKWYIVNYIKYIYNHWVWQFVAVFGIILLFVLYRNYIVKKLNKDLHRKIQEGISKIQEKDRLLFHQNKLASMGEMMENIAHQWRQPLSQINSTVLLLDTILEEKNLKDSEVEEKLSEIESLTLYMSNTINDFKEFYEPDKEKIIFELHQIVNDSLLILSESLKTNNINVVLEIESLMKVNAYPNELKQVLIVLLNNAMDVLMQRKIEMAKITIEIQNDSKFIYLRLIDNAGGIEKNHIDRVFEPYYTTKHKSQGTGLGLYIAKLIIEESCSGELSVSNEADGAVFEMKLRLTND